MSTHSMSIERLEPSASTVSCRKCAARSCACTARKTSSPRSDAQALYNAVGSQTKRCVSLPPKKAARSTAADYLTLVVATMWDWFEDKLKP